MSLESARNIDPWHDNFDFADKSTWFHDKNDTIAYVDTEGITDTPSAYFGQSNRRDLRYMHSTWRVLGEHVKAHGAMQEEFDTVQERASTLSRSILLNWNGSRQVIAIHQNAFTERWLQMTEVQRKTILLRWWPGMQLVHRADVQAYSENIKDMSPYRWTFINLEDLANPMHLLLMVNSRSRHSPDRFALQDLESSRVGLVCMHHLVEDSYACFLPKTAMLMEDVGTLKLYGKLLPGAAHGKSWHPNSGFFVLKTQERLYRFLRNLCQEMLDIRVFCAHTDLDRSVDVPFLDLSTVASIRPPRQLRLVTIAAEAHYKLQERPNYQDLFTLVEAQHEGSIDHVWLSREDPTYFAELASEWMEHFNVRSSICDTWDRMNAIYGDLLFSQLNAITLWAFVRLLLERLREEVVVVSTAQTPNSKLSQHHAVTLKQLSLALEFGRESIIVILQHVCANSPQLRPYWRREHIPTTPEYNALRSNRDRDAPTGAKTSDKNPVTTPYRLVWLLTCLTNRRQMWHIGAWMFLEELDCLMQRSKEARELVSAPIARMISDLSVIAEIERQILLFRCDEWKDLELDEQRIRELDSLKSAHRTVTAIQKAGVKLATVGKLDGRFYHPSDQLRTEETVQQMRLAENKLDKFWKEVDKAVRKKTGRDWFDIAQIEKRSLERTAPWTEPLEQNSKPEAHGQRLTHGIEQRLKLKNSDKLALAQRTTKQKTRSADTAQGPDSKTLSSLTLPEADFVATISLGIQVDRDAMRIFDALFATSKALVQIKEIPWRDFLYAMTSVGCRAVKLHGSVWSFGAPPSSPGPRKGINLHEPHPGAVLTPIQAKIVGRRLTRAFGWDCNSFVLP